MKYSWMYAPAICTLVSPSSALLPQLFRPPLPTSHRCNAERHLHSILLLFLPRDDDVGPVYFMLLWVFVGGKMLDEERMAFESMQARLIDSEDRMHHYEMLLRNRDQELTKTKRVSTATYTDVSRMCIT
jgi:hypothetical protein